MRGEMKLDVFAENGDLPSSNSLSSPECHVPTLRTYFFGSMRKNDAPRCEHSGSKEEIEPKALLAPSMLVK